MIQSCNIGAIDTSKKNINKNTCEDNLNSNARDKMIIAKLNAVPICLFVLIIIMNFNYKHWQHLSVKVVALKVSGTKYKRSHCSMASALCWQPL